MNTMREQPSTNNLTTENPATSVPPVTIYRANQRHELGLIHTWTVMAKNVWGARELIWQLWKRDFFAGYKKSFLGFSWAFISPVVGIIPWVFAQKVQLLNPGDTDIPYPVYILLGKSMFSLFTGFYNSGASTLGSGGALLMQVNYPHEAMLFKQVASQLSNYLIAFATSLVVMMAFGIFPSWWVLALPLAALPLFFLGAAIGLVVGMIRVVSMDLNRIITIFMGFLMWTVPIIYSENTSSQILRTVNKYNPLTYLVCSCRDLVVHGRLYDNNALAYFGCAAVAFLLFLISWRLFFISENKLVERMI